jgi:hypothetical protein
MNECGEFEDWTPIIHIKDDSTVPYLPAGRCGLGLIDDDSLPDMVMTAVVDVDGENIIAAGFFDIDAKEIILPCLHFT